jgi:predicted metal-binding membrane protein
MNQTAGCGITPLERSGRAVLLVSLGALITAAWLTLWLWGGRAHGFPGTAHGATGHGLDSFVLVVAGWTVMTTAMMLPTSLPVIGLLHALAADRPDRGRLTALAVGGYVIVWCAFGVAVWLVQPIVRGLLEVAMPLQEHPELSAAAILLLAGGYQFTPLKARCLEKCRSPLSFVLTHWQGRNERRQAFRLGMDHGLFCVGCCWTLMLLMFLTGAGHIAWMFLLGAIMAVEKNVSWGQRLSAPLGVVLLVASVVLVVQGQF